MSASQEVPTANTGLKHRARETLVKFLIAVMGAFAGFIGGPPLQAWACQTYPLLGNHFTAFCGEEFKRIDVADAEIRLMYYYSKAGAPGETGAWSLYTDTHRILVPFQGFTNMWAPYSWAEVISTPEVVEGRLNVFTVRVRFYEADGNARFPRAGRIQERRITVGLEAIDGVLLIREENWNTTPVDERVRYPYPAMPTPHVTYHNALVDAEWVALPISQQQESQGRLSILCKLDESDETVTSMVKRSLGKDNVELWYRTPEGWLPASAMPNAKTDDVPACNYRYAEFPYAYSSEYKE